jgi:hypothetical protein
MSKRNTNSISVTDIAGLGVCEQQTVLDRRFGKVRSAELKARARDGIRVHASFHEQVRSANDPRCFIASTVFGRRALETHILRTFRDRHLMPYRMGRLFCRCYYRVSPMLIPWLARSAHARAGVRLLLRLIVHLVAPFSRTTTDD